MRAPTPCAMVRAVWHGLVVLGLLHVGESEPEAGPAWLPAPDALPPGHPERLRPDLPLTALERRLLRELRRLPGASGLV
ncbi:DUF6059 family protein [Kitasatospora sp. LaBMicrA B282]|uniref:DUF6059 family protein n=1 Tax=Kitasatospora sp. LaBMicrA B282 TaxID=3420949 RepID=UPI003D0AA25B